MSDCGRWQCRLRRCGPMHDDDTGVGSAVDLHGCVVRIIRRCSVPLYRSGSSVNLTR